MGWPGLRPLTGSTLFNLASGCYTITLGQALFERSGSVSAFTGIVVIEYVVPVVLGAVAGSMADRVNPAGVCAVASIVPALSLIAYLVAPAGLYVVTCDATARLDFSTTPLAWGVFWSPTLHAHAEALPPPFRQ